MSLKKQFLITNFELNFLLVNTSHCTFAFFLVFRIFQSRESWLQSALFMKYIKKRYVLIIFFNLKEHRHLSIIKWIIQLKLLDYFVCLFNEINIKIRDFYCNLNVLTYCNIFFSVNVFVKHSKRISETSC